MDKKEIEDFVIRLAGAMAGGLEDAGIEAYYWIGQPGTTNQFPYQRPHPKLPTYDDLIVGGLAIPPWVIGLLIEEDAKKKGDSKTAELGKDLKIFGEGDVIYSANMLLHHTIAIQPTPWLVLPYQKVAGGVRRPTGAPPGHRSDVGHIVTKL